MTTGFSDPSISDRFGPIRSSLSMPFLKSKYSLTRFVPICIKTVQHAVRIKTKNEKLCELSLKAMALPSNTGAKPTINVLGLEELIRL